MSDRVRVLTANLWNGRADAEGFARLVAEQQADVVAVQEMTPEQARPLERVLPHGRLEPARDHMGMGIALRHPAPVERLELPGRPARRVRLEAGAWPGLVAPLEILNVHLLPPHSWPTWRTLAQRREQVRALTSWLDRAPPAPRALVGDLNATPAWPAYRELVRRMGDAVHHAPEARPRPTWGPWHGAPRLLRIDHVLVDRVGVARLEVLRVAGSDHDAVLVELSLPSGSAATP